MSTERQIALNTAGRYLAIAISMVTGLIITPFLIHAVGKSAYGLQALSSQAVQFVSLAATAISLSYDRFAATHYARREFDRMNAALAVGFGLSLASATVMLAGTGLTAFFAGRLFDLPPDLIAPARWVLLIAGTTAACHIVNGVWKAPLFITQRFYIESFGSMVAYVSAAVLVVLLFHVTTPTIVLWVVLSCGLRLVLEWIVVIPLARRALPDMHISLRHMRAHPDVRGFLNFSGLNFLTCVGALLFYATDSIIIANMGRHGLGIAHVTDYNLAQRWDPQIRMIVSAFVGVLTPLLTTDVALGNMDRVRNTIIRGTRYSLILALLPCTLLVVFVEPFFHFWLQHAFAPVSVPVLRVIMGALILSVPGMVAYEALYATGRLGRAVTIIVAGGLLNLVLSIYFVRATGLGLLGIALGSAISLVLAYALSIPLLACRATALPVVRLLAHGCLRATLGAIPLFAICLALRRWWIPSNLITVFAQFAVCSLVYAASVWCISLTTEDRAKTLRAAASLFASRHPRP